MLEIPFLHELAFAQRVLVAGAGGGYDVFCGLPLYFALRDAGKQVWLANLSFTSLESCAGKRRTPALLEIDADSGTPGLINYFPEGYLTRWFRERGDEVSVFCLHRTGVAPLREAYERLLAELQFDTLILVDGGTDSLMRGDEDGRGTPHEDVASLAATHELPIPRKLLACLGFGVDAFHGVSHYHYLEAVAELIREGAYLGAFSLTADMPTVELFRQATQYVFARMPHHPSIVNSSILSAIAGHYGDHHATDRTRGSELWINPLMALYWCFYLEPVARRVQYLDAMKQTETMSDVVVVLARWLATRPEVREARPIPL